ncbi:MAG: phytanoyl-CoA dioxygenase family protein [Maricaulaceae bacterium]|jgi:ectoine hydroxylase-related dioxygenase (phytanoyl-CoA dioxygenase family)
MTRQTSTQPLSPEQLRTFDNEGLVRIPQAVDPADAAAMAQSLWRALEHKTGARSDDPATWPSAPVSGFAATRRANVFAAMASPTVCAVLDQLLGAAQWTRPPHWGVPLVNFPDRSATWDLPRLHWHSDHPISAEDPAVARAFVILAPLQPRAGGTLFAQGSHILLRRIAEKAGRTLRSAEAKRRLKAAHPWFADLTRSDAARADGAGDRTLRFMEQGAVVDGVEVKVVQMAGEPGDAYFMHPSLLHSPSANVGDKPRMVLTETVLGAAAAEPTDA